jgi:transposase
MSNILVHYTPPTKLELAPHGSIWKAIGDNDTYTFFIQIGTLENINWIRLGDFLEKTFEKNFEDKDFLKMCLEQYSR